MNIGEKIRRLRLRENLTQEELATATGTTKQTIHKYETGIISNIPASKIKAIADKLNTTPAFLMGWDENKFRTPGVTEDYTTFPVIGEIAAGYNHYADEDWSGETVDIPNVYLKGHDKTDFFVLGVKGDSMFPAYQNGDKVLILKQATLNYSGQVGAVLYEDTYATLKRVDFVNGEDWMRLVPINPSFPSQRIEGEQLEHCRILGIPRLLLREITE